MPELPEVETIRRALVPHLHNQHIEAVRCHRADLRFPFPQNFARRLEDRYVTELARRGKYILIHLDGDLYWIIHLGMTGHFSVEPSLDKSPLQPRHKHEHVSLKTRNNDILRFIDARRFGFMQLLSGTEKAAYFARMGAEPLSTCFTPDYLYKALRGRKTPIKNALLDQSIIAGLGNIYVCEALFDAGIAPSRQAGRIARARLEKLQQEIIAVLERAITAGGSSIRDFQTLNGESGYFQHGFKVYGRAGQACLTADCKGKIKRVVQAGRASFYCPACQK